MLKVMVEGWNRVGSLIERVTGVNGISGVLVWCSDCIRVKIECWEGF